MVYGRLKPFVFVFHNQTHDTCGGTSTFLAAIWLISWLVYGLALNENLLA